MKLESDASVGDTAWDETVRACGGTVFHSSAWSRYVSRAYLNTTPIRFRLVGDGGHSAGAALGFRTRSSNRLVAPLTGRLWFDALPATIDSTNGAELVKMLEEDARRCGDVELQIGSFGCSAGADAIRNYGYFLEERLEFELDLLRPEHELWAQLDRARRNKINKARRSGVTIHELGPNEGLPELYRLHEVTMQRLSRRGVARHEQSRHAAGREPERELLDAGDGFLLGARHEDAWVSVDFFARFNGMVYHVLSGHAEHSLRLAAPSLLLWDAMVRSKNAGFTRFNLGGCKASAEHAGSPEHGLYQYKLDFGGRVLRCASGSRVLRPVRASFAKVLRYLSGRR